MVHDVPVVLQPRCPPPDDRELDRLLELLRVAAGLSWIVLELQVDGDDTVHRYAAGEPRGDETTTQLQLTGFFSGRLITGDGSTLAGSLIPLVSLSVDRLLSARRMREQVLLLRGALDATTSSILLFDVEGQIIFANPPADRLLSRQTEKALVVARSTGAPQPLFNRLCHLVQHINAEPDQRSSWRGSLSLSDGTQLACEIIRVPLAEHNTGAGVLVHLQEIVPLALRVLADFCLDYGLSPREEEVSRLILEGLATGDIAARLGISPHTVRDHVKHLYRKTATTSRSELLAMMAAANPGPAVDNDPSAR